MSDAWEDEGYAGEDEWGQESIEVDLEEELLELDEDGTENDELDEALLDLDEDA